MSLARNGWVRAFNGFLRQTLGYIRQKKPKLMGEDHLGNKYYEEERPLHDYRKTQRFYMPKFPREPGPVVDLMDIPPEWQAWLSFRRKEPPTPQDSRQEQLMTNDGKTRKIGQDKAEP